MALLRQAAAYGTVLTVAASSVRFSESMDANLMLMSDAAVRSSALQAKSDADAASASELEEKAAADAERSGMLREEAEAVRIEAEEDEARAARDEAASTTAAEEAAADEAEAEADLAAAAAEEAVAEADATTAAAEAAAAAESEAEAAEDVAAVAACELIPFLDVICDVVGTAAEIGLQTAAAAQAAESAAEAAAAVAARAEEESELATAAALQAGAAELSAEASELEAKAGEEEARSEAEYAEAEADEADADASLQRSGAEQAEATEEEAAAVAEDAEADESLAAVARHGAAAMRDAFRAGLASLVALLYFGWRLTTKIVMPGVFGGCKKVVTVVSSSSIKRDGELGAKAASVGFSRGMLLRRGSECLVHVVTFLTALWTFGAEWAEFETYTRRSRGGIVLLFGCLAGVSQGLALHAVPRLHAELRSNARRSTVNCERIDGNTRRERARGFREAACVVCRAFLAGFIFLFPLFVIEALILWVLFGDQLFTSHFIQTVHPLVWWALFAFGASLHFLIFEANAYSSINDAKATVNVKSADQIDEETELIQRPEGNGLDRRAMNESDALLADETDSTPKEEKARQSAWDATTRVVLNYFHDLHIPFEALVLCCMFALLRSCTPKFLQLFPLYKLLPSAPNMSLGGVLGFCILSGMIISYVACFLKLRDRTRKIHERNVPIDELARV